MSSILRDEPEPVARRRPDAPDGLSRLVSRCLEKQRENRIQTASEILSELKALHRGYENGASSFVSKAAPHPGAVRAEEGFWIAVLPFKCRSTDPDLTALAEGLTDDIVTGLSRFSYLRVIAHRETLSKAIDVRSARKELGARYVMEGNLHRTGSRVRISVQLADANLGAHLWAETYERSFSMEDIFALQDDLVPRIVSTVADWYGILPHTMSEALRSRNPSELSPYEAVLRSFGYAYRFSPQEHAMARAGLERAVRQAPDYADAWAMLSRLISEEFAFGMNAQPDPLGRALEAARRAADAAPLNAFAHTARAKVLFFRRELEACRSAAEHAIALNPMDGATAANMGLFIAYAGDWEYGCGLVERGMQLNPRHPGWYWTPLSMNAYRKGDYRRALAIALRIDMPASLGAQVLIAATYGQLGERDAAGTALRELLQLRSDIAVTAPMWAARWFDPALVENLMDGLRKAGLDVQTRAQ